VTADEVIEAVCSVTKVSREELAGADRHFRVSRPRHLAIYLLHTELHLPCQQIAEIFGRHTKSIPRYVRDARALLDYVPIVSRWLNDVKFALSKKAA